MSKALELAKFGRETIPTGAVVGDSDTQTLSNKTFSTNPVISSGTANGVAYLNGSKALTTGTALIFDGTNLGVGTTNPVTRLSVNTATQNSEAATIGGIEYGGTKRGLSIRTFSSLGGDDCGVEFNAAPSNSGYGSFKFTAASTTLMTLDSSGNLGVGRIPGAARLDLEAASGQTKIILRNVGNTIDASTYIAAETGSSGDWANLSLAARHATQFLNNGTERMRLDSGGTLGIGTTSPSTYAGANGQLVIYGGVGTTFTNNPQNITLVNNGTIAAGLGTGILFSANYNNSIVTTYAIISGIRENGTSGSAAGALVFGTRGAGGGVDTERMRLDSSGNLGVGTTSPPAGYRAQFVDTRAADSVAVGVRNLSANGIARFVIGNDIGFARMTIGYTGSTFTNPSIGWIGTEGTEPFYFQTAGTERVRIDASGNLGVGTTSPSTGKFGDASCAVLVQSSDPALGTNIFSSNSNNTKFVGFWSGHSGAEPAVGVKTGNALTFGAWGAINGAGGFTERARFDSSGNFFIGKTTQLNANGFSFMPNMYGTGVGLFDLRGNSTSNVDTIIQAYRTANSTYAFFIQWSGQIYAQVTSISSASDASLKQNIRSLETGLSEILALQPRRFDWIDGRAQNVAGFVAQEVQPVLPDLIENAKFRENDNGTTEYKLSIRMSDMIPTMVKAIQEQQALITQLQADVAALKGGNP